MATDNLQALFGGTMLPQDMQQELINKRAAEFAQLTPSQQLSTMGYKTGAAIGGGLAQAMGVDITDPRIKRQSQLQALSQGVENTSEGLMQFAQKLRNAGFAAEAAQAMDKAREIAATEAGTGLKNAQAEKARNYEQASADATKKRTLVSTVEADLASGKEVDPVRLNEAKLAAKEYAKPRMVSNGAGGYDVLPGIDLTDFPNLGKVITSGGGAVGGAGGGSNVTTMGTALSEEAKRNRLSGLEGSSAQLQTTLDTITQTMGLIGNKTTGWGNYLAGIPNTQAMTLADNTDTIKASVALTKLMEMKKESKTGASGLGALNVKELETVQSILGKLNPKSANYATDLKKVEDFFVRAKKAMDEEVRLTQGVPQQQPQRPAAPSGGGNNNWQNPQGKEGQLAILNAELAKAQQQGNQADIAGLQREISRLGGQPDADYEGRIKRNLEGNPSYTRAQVISNLIAAKRLPADYK